MSSSPQVMHPLPPLPTYEMAVGTGNQVVRQPLQQRIPPNMPMVTATVSRLSRTEFLKQLIFEAHRPDLPSVTLAQEEEMADKMRILYNWVLGFKPAEPTSWWDGKKKQITHDKFAGPVGFEWFIDEMLKAFQGIRNNRPAKKEFHPDGTITIKGGPSVWHRSYGFRISRCCVSLRNKLQGNAGKDFVDKLRSYTTVFAELTSEEHNKTFPFHINTGSGLYGERGDQLHQAAALEPKQHFVPWTLSEAFLRQEELTNLGAGIALQKSRELSSQLAALPARSPFVQYTYDVRTAPDGSRNYCLGVSGQQHTPYN